MTGLPQPDAALQGTAVVGVVMPAHNEEATLPGVLTSLLAYVPADRIVVVNDGSSDATGAVAAAYGVRVATCPINLGVGGAIRVGLRLLLRDNVELVVQMDADGQHDPADIPALLSPVIREEADLVIGARFSGVGDYRVGPLRRVAMSILALAVRLRRTEPLTDVTSGFKAMNRSTAELLAGLLPFDYLGDTVEAILIVRGTGRRVTQVPVQMKYRQGGSPSHPTLRSIRSVARVLVAVVFIRARSAVGRLGQR